MKISVTLEFQTEIERAKFDERAMMLQDFLMGFPDKFGLGDLIRMQTNTVTALIIPMNAGPRK